MRALSLFSGIGGIDLGLERAGIRVVGQCEADAWCRAVLAERFPGVPCWDDVRDVRVGEPARRGAADPVRAAAHDRRREARPGLPDGVDLLCGGFPCQDVSVAGKRAGLAGARTGLFWEFLRIADTLRPRWLLLENVPGLLSSNSGRDFATIVAALDDAGYVGAWRVLDSRWFGVPQRRRRVFILCADARFDPRGERCAEVLAVGTRCARHPRTGGTTGADVAGALAGRSASRLDDACAGGGQLVAAAISQDALRGEGRALTPSVDADGRARLRDPGFSVGDVGDPAFTVAAAGPGAVAFHVTQDPISGDVAPAMSRGNRQGTATIGVAQASGVRRLTPRECERLQGFPDEWTQVEWKGKPSPDSRRYAALGNAVTVQVAEWIGHRILDTDHMEVAA